MERPSPIQLLKRVLRRAVLPFLDTRRRFTRIYRRGGWGSQESVSGRGSTLAATEPIRREMVGLLRRYDVRTLLDAPCGDFNWMAALLSELGDHRLEYIGVEIVSELVERNRASFGSERVRFLEADIIRDPLPTADLVLCRDCFIHFSNADVLATVANVGRSGARYLLTNSFREIARNENIPTGSWRQLNLERPPFDFPAPLEAIDEAGYGTHGKFLGLWELRALEI